MLFLKLQTEISIVNEFSRLRCDSQVSFLDGGFKMEVL